MNKEFVPYKEAFALKELGFDEVCYGQYDNGSEYKFTGMRFRNSDSRNSVVCALPLWQQAFRWFRREHGYHGEVIQTTNKYNVCRDEYQYGICKYHQKPFYYETYGNPEEAQLACLRELIKKVKNENK